VLLLCLTSILQPVWIGWEPRKNVIYERYVFNAADQDTEIVQNYEGCSQSFANRYTENTQSIGI